VTIARSPRSSVAKRPFCDIFRRITPISLNIAPPTVDIQMGFPYIIIVLGPVMAFHPSLIEIPNIPSGGVVSNSFNSRHSSDPVVDIVRCRLLATGRRKFNPSGSTAPGWSSSEG
jgi:hypothetical protein